MMLQAVGGTLVIASAFLIGWRASEDLEKEYRQLGELQKISSMLQGEIRYARAFLAEAFGSIARTAQEPYKSWMLEMHQRMNAKESGSFACIWEKTARECLADLSISDIEKRRLYDLGKYLGNADTQMQLTHLKMYEEQLEILRAEKRQSLHTKKKLYRVLGAAGGIFLAILLI